MYTAAHASSVQRSHARAVPGTRSALALVAAVALLATGLAKLFAVEGVRASLLGSPAVARLIGALELTLALGLCMRRSRPTAARLGSMFAALGVTLASVRILGFTTADCGCLGGWMRLGPWVQAGLGGLMLALLSGAAYPPSARG